MGKIMVTVQGTDADMQRLYDHLSYNVKKISETRTESFKDHKKQQEFWVMI